ncbi:MAG: hypothetical protein GY841_22105 [FCB group bacterium]|nr:hypothetical protein [FCB group bacterium]
MSIREKNLLNVPVTEELKMYVGRTFAGIVGDGDFDNPFDQWYDWGEDNGNMASNEVRYSEGDADFGVLADFRGGYLIAIGGAFVAYVNIYEDHGIHLYPDVPMMQFLGHEQLVTFLPDRNILKEVATR